MKLTDKAVDEFIENEVGFMHPSKWEFEPTDFKDSVVLTLEEAKIVKEALAFASCPSFINSDAYFTLFEKMKKRIEQVEEYDTDEVK